MTIRSTSNFRPLIGIPNRLVSDPDFQIPVQGNCSSYAESVLAAGGVPIFIPILDGMDLSPFLELCDGFILSGGEDVDPVRYNENPSPKLGKVSSLRDEVEIEVFNKAMNASKPVLGICRGLQLINVACGGSLFQDIPTENPSELSHTTDIDCWYKTPHDVQIREGSMLHTLFGTETVKANSIHHQAIKVLGKGLVASATASDGVIEAFEFGAQYGSSHNSELAGSHSEHGSITNREPVGPMLAVQWHPEVMWQGGKGLLGEQRMLKLFEWLVNKASKLEN